MSVEKIKVGFSIGDINGIGPEIIVRALENHRILKLCTPIIYASNRLISYFKKNMNAEGFNYSSCNSAAEANPKTINIINCIVDDIQIQTGVINKTGARAAYISLDAAVNDLISGEIQALVTAPIHKQNMQQEGFQFNGHTGYLTHRCNATESLMILTANEIRIAVVTEHVPIKEVASLITTERIVSKLQLLNNSLRQDFGIDKPTIAVLGLNPHAGDNGLIGTEEKEVIIPAIEAIQKQGILAVGPFPADGFFGNNAYRKFDAILAMYHDQGLIPFKTLAFEEGVNFTAGLPVIRTSPDHGTAFDIAGKNLADHSSILAAIFTAIDIWQQRSAFKENRSNPLKRNLLEAE